MTSLVAAVCLLGAVPAGLRWLRVAQREHYLAPSVTRFAWRWWIQGALNRLLLTAAVLGLAGTFLAPWPGLIVALAQVGPLGLGVRGSSSPLVWTSRLKRVAALAGALIAGMSLWAGFSGSAVPAAAALVFLPVLIDLSLLVLSPVEARLGNRWVERAAAKLKASGALVVAITGSYGKTTTKAYVERLLRGSRRTVASPASFNNRMGLARAINEQLVPGTEVFVAEMGTYGKGEIAALCRWIPPDVAALVAIGPVHLERFRSQERIVEAKAEILDRARTAVIPVDDRLLRDVAADRVSTLDVITVSTGEREAKVRLVGRRVRVDGVDIGPIDPEAFGLNVVVAVGICLALGLEPEELAERLLDLPRPAHRQTVSTSELGFVIIDDTYNSNPTGAAAGIALLGREGEGGRKVVVTPGMVELGPIQSKENFAFAARASAVADDLVIVGGTNRSALLAGSKNGGASVTVVDSREEAVRWVQANLGPGDAVLYENDLPDHYP